MRGYEASLEAARPTIERYRRPENVEAALSELAAAWEESLCRQQVRTPDPALDAMLNGEWLDHESFMRHTGSWRLAAVICTLRALGWPVQSRPIATANAEHEQRTIALYSLSSKDLAEAFANGSGCAA